MMLFVIVCIFWLSLCVVLLLSAPYVIIGMMHISTSFHIMAIFSPLKFLSFAMWSIVWYAASTFPSSIFRFPLLLIISPRCLYFSVSSISMSPSFSSVLDTAYFHYFTFFFPKYYAVSAGYFICDV